MRLVKPSVKKKGRKRKEEINIPREDGEVNYEKKVEGRERKEEKKEEISML